MLHSAVNELPRPALSAEPALTPLPPFDIGGFVAEMEAFGFRYVVWVEAGEVVAIHRLEPVSERAEDTDAINALLWRLRATPDWRRLLGDFCVATGRVYGPVAA